MPRQTKLKQCVKCGSKKVRVGISMTYYLHSNVKKRRPGTVGQTRGSFPATGYCAQCFITSKRFSRLSEEKQKEVRKLLAGER